MSPTGSLQDDITRWEAIDNGRQIVFAAFTLIIYEYFITLDQEENGPRRGVVPGEPLFASSDHSAARRLFNAKVSLELYVQTLTFFAATES
ncbi:hypothetical protein BD779DRAFT_1680477 [Infundibulicybe gibba]|nr:hypothetical protein BD779DRAFT_1680477 [Infundibulicybe gibba]